MIIWYNALAIPDSIRSGSLAQYSAFERDSFLATVYRVGVALLMFLGLSQLYVDYVSVTFAYYGFTYNYEVTRWPLAVIVIALQGALLRPRISGIADLLSVLSFQFFLIPTSVMYVYGGLYFSVFVWTAIIQIVLIWISVARLPVRSLFTVRLTTLIQILFILSVVGLLFIIYQNGLFSFGFNIADVYERRLEANEADLGIFGYLQQMGAQAALLLIAVAFYNRQLVITFVGISLSIAYFAYTGHKSMLFWSAFLVGILCVGRFRKKFLVFISVSLIFIWSVVFLMDSSVGESVANYLVRRTVFTPILLNQYYVMFADQFGYLQWSYSKIGLGLFEYTDTVSPTQAVGQYLTGQDTNSANTGMIGFGYINAGHAGVAAYVVIFSALLIYASGASRCKQIEMLGAAILVRSCYFAITTSDLPSTILSGGLGYALIVLLVYPEASKSTANVSSAHGVVVREIAPLTKPQSI